MDKKLFSQCNLGKLTLKNRIVMAPMTRCRAQMGVPQDLMVKYYELRADAGLLITEGVAPSPNGLGYARIPGCYSSEQAQGWRKIAAAVHARGGKIFMQLMHTGRVTHPLNLPDGAEVIAPSAVQLTGQMWTDQKQMQSYPVPREMTKADIQKAVQEYAKAAKLAVEAGLDGVELHGANGYLIDQFLNPASNRRSDEYGGSSQNRIRFALEVAQAVVAEIGADRLGIRLSPYGVFNDMIAFEGLEEQYGLLTEKLSELGLVYIHVVDHSSMGAPEVKSSVKSLLRQKFKNSMILSGGYDAESAERDLLEGKGDLIAFGRPFISSPKLVDKFKKGSPLVTANPDTFYTPGEAGYSDYPV